MEYISVLEYARFLGKTPQYIRQQIVKGNIQAVGIAGELGGGKNGIAYRIPVDSLDPKTYRKYQREQKKKLGFMIPGPEKPRITLTLEEMSEDERRQVAFWKKTLEEWKAFRNRNCCKAEADRIFVERISEQYPEMHFSVRILQRKDQAWREQGEAALIDRRGKHNNHKKAIPDEVFAVFTSYYLDESQKGVRKCMDLTESYLKHVHKEGLLPLASPQTFTREILRSIPPAALVLCREGMNGQDAAIYPQDI